MIEIVERMMELQAQLGETDYAFGKRIGVHAKMIAYLYALERRPGSKVLGGLLIAFPGQFEVLVLDFLRDQVTFDA